MKTRYKTINRNTKATAPVTVVQAPPPPELFERLNDVEVAIGRLDNQLEAVILLKQALEVVIDAVDHLEQEQDRFATIEELDEARVDPPIQYVHQTHHHYHEDKVEHQHTYMPRQDRRIWAALGVLFVLTIIGLVI